MGWREIFDFRLIDPDFDGDSKLSEILGLRGQKLDPRIPITRPPAEPPDEKTERMIQYLKREIDYY